MRQSIEITNKCKFDQQVVTYTSQIRGASTEANVFLELIGDRNQSGRFELDAMTTSFQRGQVDVFFVTLNNVGTLLEVIIGHDNSGSNPQWHLELVEITDTKSEQVHTLQMYCYIVCLAPMKGKFI